MVKIHSCKHPGCGKQFNRKFNLDCHYRIHTGETPYLCSHKSCSRAFRWKSSLNHHLHSLYHATPSTRAAREAQKSISARATRTSSRVPKPRRRLSAARVSTRCPTTPLPEPHDVRQNYPIHDPVTDISPTSTVSAELELLFALTDHLPTTLNRSTSRTALIDRRPQFPRQPFDLYSNTQYQHSSECPQIHNIDPIPVDQYTTPVFPFPDTPRDDILHPATGSPPPPPTTTTHHLYLQDEFLPLDYRQIQPDHYSTGGDSPTSACTPCDTSEDCAYTSSVTAIPSTCTTIDHAPNTDGQVSTMFHKTSPISTSSFTTSDEITSIEPDVDMLSSIDPSVIVSRIIPLEFNAHDVLNSTPQSSNGEALPHGLDVMLLDHALRQVAQ